MRYENAKKVSILGIIGNIFLFIIKIIVGIISNSKSMIADSLNSFADIFASLMTYIGNRISSTPNDSDHEFGHGKAEYIFSMLISISMMVIAFKLLYDSVMSIVNNEHLVFSNNLLIVCAITIIIKLSLFIYCKNQYKKEENILIKSNMLDHRNDCFITTLTLIAIVFAKYNIFFVDGIIGVVIGLWIMITGIKLFNESYEILMDTAIDSDSKKKILKIIKNNKSIKRIGTFYSVPVGYKYVIVITIYVDGNMKTSDSHEITEKLEQEILESNNRIEKTIIHVEPLN